MKKPEGSNPRVSERLKLVWMSARLVTRMRSWVVAATTSSRHLSASTIMSLPVANTSDDGVCAFVPYTRMLLAGSPQCREMLDAAGYRVRRNNAIADELDLLDMHKEAGKLRRCNTEYSANDPEYLLPTYYCRQPNVCSNCDSVRAAKSVDQLVEACCQYCTRMRTQRLMLHPFIIKPLTLGLGSSSIEDLEIATGMLLEFRSVLMKEHEKKSALVNSVKTKYQSWGPTMNSLHWCRSTRRPAPLLSFTCTSHWSPVCEPPNDR